MAASSVQGVGTGSALKMGQKGAEDMFLGVEKLIGPRIILTGSITLSGATGAVVFPSVLPGVAADYIVFTAGSVAHSYASAVTTSGFTANGTSGNTVQWMVVKVTNATVTTPGYPYAH